MKFQQVSVQTQQGTSKRVRAGAGAGQLTLFYRSLSHTCIAFYETCLSKGLDKNEMFMVKI